MIAYTVSLTGDKELDRKFRELSGKMARKVGAQGIRAGLRVVAKGIKSEIPSHMKEAKKAIGSRFKRNTRKGDGIIMAKVGAQVGMKEGIRAASDARLLATHRQGRGTGERPGVGIGIRNIHWLLRGTRNRHHKKTGKATGSTAPIPAVRLGYDKSKAEAMQKITENVRKGIAREANKK